MKNTATKNEQNTSVYIFAGIHYSTMNYMTESSLKELLLTESAHIQKLNQIVLNAIDEEKLISEKLYEFEQSNLPLGSRVADRIASFGGSWRFIASFIALLLLWICTNLFLLANPIDPFPFILLNLLLSMIAALQAPIIMMSQNRREEKDRQRAVNDYMVNLKAEIEIRNMHQKLDLLITEQMKTMFEIQNLQLELMRDIQASIDKT